MMISLCPKHRNGIQAIALTAGVFGTAATRHGHFDGLRVGLNSSCLMIYKTEQGAECIHSSINGD